MRSPPSTCYSPVSVLRTSRSAARLARNDAELDDILSIKRIDNSEEENKEYTLQHHPIVGRLLHINRAIDLAQHSSSKYVRCEDDEDHKQDDHQPIPDAADRIGYETSKIIGSCRTNKWVAIHIV